MKIKSCPIKTAGSLARTTTIGHGQNIPCDGSDCAFWDAEPIVGRIEKTGEEYRGPGPNGRCGVTKSANFPDPARRSS